MISPFRALPVALLLAAPSLAQETPQATPTPGVLPPPVIVVPPLNPTPTPRPTLVPTLPTTAPTPVPTVAASPAAVPDARPSPSATRPAPVRATPSPTPEPVATPAPLPSVTPTAAAPVETPAQTPGVTAPVPTTAEAQAADRPLWPWALGVGLVLLAAIGLRLAKRRRDEEPEDYPVEEAEPVEVVPPTPVATPRLTLAFRPTRAGFNLLSATVEGELEVANQGDAPAEGLRVRTALLSAHVGQDADLAGFVAEPIARPAVPAFSLAPGEARTLRVVAAAPREGLRTMTAGGRPMFVPVVAVNLLAADGAQVAQAFAVGIERVDSAKLAPFWLDVPPRSYAEVAARPHGAAVERR